MLNKIFLCALIFLVATATWISAREWEEVNIAVAPPARTAHVSVEFAGKVYIFGGRNPSTDDAFFNDIWEFSNGDWEEINDANPPAGVEGHAATVVDDKMYVFGGRGEDGVPRNTLHEFDFATNTWAQVNAGGELPVGTVFATMTTVENKIYLHGGFDTTGRPDFFMREFDPATNTWSKKAIDSFAGRFGHSSFVRNGEIYNFMGTDRNGNTTDLISIYTVATDTFRYDSISTGEFPVSRSYQAMAENGDSLFMFGGLLQDKTISNETWEFNFATNSWSKREDTLTPFFNATAAFVNNSRAGDAFVFGGETDGGQVLNKTFQYAPGGIVPPQEKELTATIGSLASNRCASFILKFKENQENVKVILEWADKSIDLQVFSSNNCDAFCDPKQDEVDRRINRYNSWLRLPAHKALRYIGKFQEEEMRGLCVATSKIVETSNGKRLETSFNNVKTLVIAIKHGKTQKMLADERCGGGQQPQIKVVRNISVNFDSKDNPEKFVFLFPVGPPNDKNNLTRHEVSLPVVPVRWHSKIPFFTPGEEENKQEGNNFTWSFTDKSLHIPFFGYVKFILP